MFHLLAKRAVCIGLKFSSFARRTIELVGAGLIITDRTPHALSNIGAGVVARDAVGAVALARAPTVGALARCTCAALDAAGLPDGQLVEALVARRAGAQRSSSREPPRRTLRARTRTRLGARVRD